MEEKRAKLISMDTNKKYLKQTLSLKVVCATFILDYIEKDVYNSLKINSRSRTTRNVLSNISNNTTKNTLKASVNNLKKIEDSNI